MEIRMGNVLRKLTYCALVLLGAWSCSRELVPEADPASDEIPVRIGYTLSEKPLTPATRASIVGGNEKTADGTNYISSLKMLCFTVEGIYLGYRDAILNDNETNLPDYQYNPDGSLKVDGGGKPITVNNECWGRYLFEGTVPARTARIHFVANVTNDQIPGNDQLGGNENMLIRSAKMVSTTSNRNIAYWGFHGEDSPEEMQAWLSVKETSTDGEGNTVVTGYNKREGSVVHLIRDRAWVHFGAMNDIDGREINDGETRQIDYTILTIDWVVVNGRDHGYLAPYNEHNSDDHFTGYYDESAAGTAENPRLKTDRLTEYTRSDGARFNATESDMERVYIADGYTPTDGVTSVSSNPEMFLFEDMNNQTERPKVVLKVLYKKYKDRPDLVTKYHTLMLLDKENSPCQIFRNHKYVLNINGLPWEGLGYGTFKDAMESTEYANNRTVSIDERVEEVNDGRYILTIDGGTSSLYSSGTGSSHTVEFRYQAVPGAGGDVSGITKDNFTTTWTEAIDDSFANSTIKVDDYDPSTGIGHFTYTLGTVISNILQSGSIELHDKNSGLSRFVNVYTITNFKHSVTANSLVRDGSNTRIVGATGTSAGVSCNTYKMTFTIPKDYPKDLYPVVVRIASTTLNPFSIYRGTTQVGETFKVVMESTENGASLDGAVLSGMDFTTTPNPWNYRANGSPWNYWYTFTIMSKPDSDGDSDDVYTIYFDDSRPLRAAVNRSENLGLFFWIKYFGDAVAVTE